MISTSCSGALAVGDLVCIATLLLFSIRAVVHFGQRRRPLMLDHPALHNTSMTAALGSGGDVVFAILAVKPR